MKNYIILVILSAIVMVCVPLALLETPQNHIPATENTTSKTTVTEASYNVTPTEDTIAVFRSNTKKTEDIPIFEYVCGSVAAEMPLAYHEEAIKAQAVACYTNAMRLKKSQSNSNGDITDNTAVHQGYIDEAQRKEKWGNDFEKYEKKLKKAVKETGLKALYYDNQLCVAAFFAISNGKTENAENIWNTKVPYLVSVNSSGDKTAKGYASTVTYNKEEFYNCLKKLDKSTEETETLKNTIEITEKSPAETVLKVKVGKKEFTGEEIRKAFGLRSPTFDIKTTKNTITFSVRGYGHGVGMSQHGANYYANEGYNYKEILNHYYKGAEIQ